MSKKEYCNRELSLIQFNRRVLEEAVNPDNPLLERGKFISICSSNLDEFFMVRVGSLLAKEEAGDDKEDAAGMSPAEQLEKIYPAVHELVDRQYDIFLNEYLPQLREAGILIQKPDELTAEQKKWTDTYFEENVRSLLTPCFMDGKTAFPLLEAKRFHIVLLLPPDAHGAEPRIALVTVPASLPRLVDLPLGPGIKRFLPIEDVVLMYAARFLGGAQPICAMPFRIIRNTDFGYRDDDAGALIAEMQSSIEKRKWGKVVRIEVPADADDRLLMYLRKQLDIQPEAVFRIPGILNPDFCMKILSSLPDFDELRFAPFTPHLDERFAGNGSIFDAMKKGDVLFNHPYDTFDPIVRLIEEAADDPDVVAIKQTLYRVSSKSPIMAALARAAQNGKQVAVLVEVRARFDEDSNIAWCRMLEKAGCHVLYGVARLKTHSKITLVIRREDDVLRHYVHLATGNYNDSTAKLYTDFGLFTCDETIGHDADMFFNAIAGTGDNVPMEKLYASPSELRNAVKRFIKRERENAENGRPARIIAKMNSLSDEKVIKWLYKAADAGVRVDLIVRGLCCLKTEGHENIHVRSIVGRFLEHSRAFMFYNNGEPEVYLSSADWMTRNLDKRVELMFPVEAPALRDRVIASLLDELSDNRKAWELRKNGKYRRAERTEPAFNVQEARICGMAELNGRSILCDQDTAEEEDATEV